MSEPPGLRFVALTCPHCTLPRLFRVAERDGRLRMACSECGLDLPARDGPVADWRELVDGPHADGAPDDGRRVPPA